MIMIKRIKQGAAALLLMCVMTVLLPKDSFVADCAMAVLKALENCISKEKFIEKMKQFGWSSFWRPVLVL